MSTPSEFEHLAYPQLVSKELANELFERGKKDRRKFLFRSVDRSLGFAFGVIVFALTLAYFVKSADMAILIYACGVIAAASLGLGVASFKVKKIQTAFQNSQFDRLAKLLPDAYHFNLQNFPLTYWHSIAVSNHLVSLMLLEGRLSELEALSFYHWGLAGGAQSLGDVPKPFAVANNLGLAYMLQKKYAEAERYFENLAQRKNPKFVQLIVLNNLAYCLVQNKRFDEAASSLEKAFVLAGESRTLATTRLKVVSAMNNLERGDLEAAEENIATASEYSKDLKLPAEYQALFESVLGAIRAKQKRYDESKLHYSNALDTIGDRDNPDYLTLANTYRKYAAMLLDAGEQELSETAAVKANEIFDLYIRRESDAVNAIQARVNDKADLLQGVKLVTLGERIKYIDYSKI